MPKRQTVRINLKHIGNPLDKVSKRLNKVIKTKKETKKAAQIYKELGVIRKRLSAICCDNRWFCDV